ncbi:MAG: glycosyltransferase family A protein [Hyphomicrobiaceae bacterium]|nr:glycosyltransferase family 2 protein [Hyphomicrobiaceae bacterium]
MPVADKIPMCSVVVPCFNAEGTIEATLSSVLAQTAADIEIIVVDDGSEDGSAGIVERLIATDARIRLIQQDNAGVAAARNAGILSARARLIALIDADDLWTPDHLALHLFRFAVFPELGVSFSTARFIDADGTVCGMARPKLTGLVPADLLASNPTTTCSTLVVRRDVFRDVGLFRTEMRHNEDQEWLFRVTLSGWVLSGVADLSVSYRTSPEGLASDLEGMRRGFDTMLVEARKLAPTLVARHEARATARTYRYLARRALRLGRPPSIARGYILTALKTSPMMLLSEPRATLATLAAALIPKALDYIPSRTARA